MYPRSSPTPAVRRALRVAIAVAAIAMGTLLGRLPEARSFMALGLHIAAGAAVYLAVLMVLYAPTLLRLLRARRIKPAG